MDRVANAAARPGAWLALLLALAAGCDRSKNSAGSGAPAAGPGPGPAASTASLTGVVRMGEKPLTHGTVAFHTNSGRVLRAVIRTDGTYEINNPPPGPAKVVVTAGAPPVGVAGGGPSGGVKLEHIDVPAKYTDPATTDLEYDITAGKQTFDIVLKP